MKVVNAMDQLSLPPEKANNILRGLFRIKHLFPVYLNSLLLFYSIFLYYFIQIYFIVFPSVIMFGESFIIFL